MAPAPSGTHSQRLYWEDARRKTALAQIAGHKHGGFLLDRSLYHAWDPEYHHKQPSDRGHLLADGHKVKLNKVAWERGHLVHRTPADKLPATGAKAQLHLDAERRDQQARTHAVMHLLIAAVAEERGELLAMPEVVGGGQINAHARFRDAPEPTLKRILQRIQRMIDERTDVTPTWMPRDEAQRAITHHVVGLDAIAPGEPTLRMIRIGEVSTLPCDAPLVTNTREIGRVLLGQSRPRVTKDGVRWQTKVLPPE